ncbi:hypothetical protein F0U61_38515 [Archangium violaceum]|uniref:hypothetical protein n=1 Tax=Archangium violaceum TaxID=83451 RepID=UPI002B2C5C0A|nr:hypothetical protein F0U61_38515 [Archangium violaceum]
MRRRELKARTRPSGRPPSARPRPRHREYVPPEYIDVGREDWEDTDEEPSAEHPRRLSVVRAAEPSTEPLP